MLDSAYLRSQPDEMRARLAARGVGAQDFDALLKLDKARRAAIGAAEELQQKQKQLARRISAAKAEGSAARGVEAAAKGEGADALRAEAAQLKTELRTAEAARRAADAAWHTAWEQIPNLPDPSVPPGEGADANQELRATPPRSKKPAPPAKTHDEIGAALGEMDFQRAARIAGSRFSVLFGGLARLERALGQFMLDLHVREHGYLEVSPPSLLREAALFGTGQLPHLKDDVFATTDGRYLSPTAEVQLSNLVRERIVPADELPLRMTALTPCFRAEAGAAGQDTRGMIRQHQFAKVELVSIVAPADAPTELERMTHCAETVLRQLELPYRVMLLCCGEMGFAAAKTYDLEVWLPGQKAWREISSCSWCTDFQARRMGARWRAPNARHTEFVHTLNGSALAVGRCLIAILENFHDGKGVAVPKVLHPYMQGLTWLPLPPQGKA